MSLLEFIGKYPIYFSSQTQAHAPTPTENKKKTITLWKVTPPPEDRSNFRTRNDF